jgi:hypothetical protein
MKVYLDDMRDAPAGWLRVHTSQECIDVLSKNRVTELSLDHDLGLNSVGTGYDVLLWIEHQVYMNNYSPPMMSVHSQNASAAAKMALAIKHIDDYLIRKAYGVL